MGDTVWVSTAPQHPSNLRPLRHSFSDNEAMTLFAIDCLKRNEAGETLPAECFPEEIFGAPHAKQSDYNLPHLFFAGSYWAVSEAAAEVLRQFDLGGGALYPVRVLKSDRHTRIDGEWFCLNFGNAKRAFLPGASRNVDPRSGGKWLARAALGDGDMALSSAALQGADIWVEPLVRQAIFLTGRLGAALRKARADKGFFLKSCRVL